MKQIQEGTTQKRWGQSQTTTKSVGQQIKNKMQKLSKSVKGLMSFGFAT